MNLFGKITVASAAIILVPAVIFLAVIVPLFSWVPERDAPDEVKPLSRAILVDRDRQILYTFEKGQRIHKFLAVTGKTGKPTPLGRFRVAWKSRDHKSAEFDGAPMPYSLFFVPRRGIAIHGSVFIPFRWRYNEFMPGEPVGSAGCVSLTKRNAEKVFEWAKVGTPVFIVGGEDAIEIGAAEKT